MAPKKPDLSVSVNCKLQILPARMRSRIGSRVRIDTQAADDATIPRYQHDRGSCVGPGGRFRLKV